MPITISSLNKSGIPWVSLRGLPLPYRLAAGRSIRFDLVYAPKDGRMMNGNLTYHSNATNPNLAFRITGVASTIGMLVANPASQSFGNVEVGTTATQSQTLTNQSNSNVSIAKVTFGRPFSVAGISPPLVLAPGHRVTLQLHFSPTALGTASERVAATSNAKDSGLTIGESGVGTSSGSVSVSPAVLSFGSVAVGSKKALGAALKATGASFTIRSASFTSNEYSLTGLSLPHTLAAGQSISFQVIFAPKSSGAADASVSFATSPMERSAGRHNLAESVGIGIKASRENSG